MGFLDFFKSKRTNIPEKTISLEPQEVIIQENPVIERQEQESSISQRISNEKKNALIDYYARLKSGYSIEEFDMGRLDPLFEDAARLIIIHNQVSVSLIQRKFAIGYNRAGKIMDQLEKYWIVSKSSGSALRTILCNSEKELEDAIHFARLTTALDEEEDKSIASELQNEIEEKAEYYSILIQKEKEEQERAEIEYEKEKVKRDLLEKKRKREIRQIALRELEEEGFLENLKKREPIPQDVQDVVWNRDGGKCVRCGSQENLEFDHIIPFSKGGSNTIRNLQLLCEKCNREKSDHIG